jgi:hypothetical protein
MQRVVESLERVQYTESSPAAVEYRYYCVENLSQSRNEVAEGKQQCGMRNDE